MALLLLAGACTSLVVPMTAAKPAASLDGVSVTRVSDGTPFDLGAALASSSSKTLLMLGTHAADFNTVEYMQRASAAWAQLKGKGVDQVLMVVNGEPAQCSKLAQLIGADGRPALGRHELCRSSAAAEKKAHSQ